jgi:sortase A
MDGSKDALRVLQWSLIVGGLALLGFWSGARLHGWLGGRAAVDSFVEARASLRPPGEPPTEQPVGLPVDLPVDTTLWAEDRIAEYEASLEHHFDAPLALLRIPKIGLEVAVLEGTDELALNRGVGHIVGTPPPGAGGNSGIAGHRDGYFRGLKDIAIGDAIEIETLDGAATYAITDLLIVEPSDVWVLEPTGVPSLTLVTCYPFYFTGSAPQRYIVRAELAGSPE